MKKIILLLGIVLLCLSWMSVGVNINSCQTLSSAKTTYILTANVNSSGSCMIIAAPEITLNCQNKNITYGLNNPSSGVVYGIEGWSYAQSYNSTYIYNCIITQAKNLTYVGAGGIILYNHTILINNTVHSSNGYGSV